MKSLDSRLEQVQKKYALLSGDDGKPHGLVLIKKEGILYEYSSKQEKYVEWIEPHDAATRYTKIFIILHNYREPFPT